MLAPGYDFYPLKGVPPHTLPDGGARYLFALSQTSYGFTHHLNLGTFSGGAEEPVFPQNVHKAVFVPVTAKGYPVKDEIHIRHPLIRLTGPDIETLNEFASAHQLELDYRRRPDGLEVVGFEPALIDVDFGPCQELYKDVTVQSVVVGVLRSMAVGKIIALN